jgi:ribosomal-protein-alanine N-acetyltransferase
MTFHVRPMKKTDIDEVYAIELLAHRAPWSHEILGDCVLVGYDCRVLEIQQSHQPKLVSYIISRYYANYCHVLNLCVDPEYQGRGYGKFLLQNLLDSLINGPCTAIILEVRPSNTPALRLYQKMGFHQIGIKEKYYSDDFGMEDAVLLEKKLAQDGGCSNLKNS